MSQTTTDAFEAVIRESGQGWLIDWFAPKEDALPHLRRILSAANARGKSRLQEDAPKLTPESIVEEYARNPDKVSAFLQVIGSVATPDILLMVWRILEGLNVAELRMNHVSERAFTMFVRLSSPHPGGKDELYESVDINDAVVLRHLGIMKMGDAPLFDGFYPLRIERKEGFSGGSLSLDIR